jgi:hypothetical protein
LLQATNRLKEAESLLRNALAINEKAYGPEHTDVATALFNLAMSTNERKEADHLLRRAVEIYRTYKLKTGHLHPYYRTVKMNMLVLQVRRLGCVVVLLLGCAVCLTWLVRRFLAAE